MQAKLKKTAITFLIISILLILQSCFSTDTSNSEDVNQNKIYQKYHISCSSSEGVRAEVIFRFNSKKGNSLKLTSPSKVEINGKNMRGNKAMLRGYVYQEEMQIEENNEYTFIFTDNEGKKYTNSIELKPIAFKRIPDEIKYGEDVKIHVETEKLKRHETVDLFITVNDTTKLAFSSDDRKIKHFLIKAADFQTVSPGKATMKLVRSVKKDLDEATSSGGIITGAYTSEPIEIDIVE